MADGTEASASLGLPEAEFRELEQWHLANLSVMLVVKARALLQLQLAVGM